VKSPKLLNENKNVLSNILCLVGKEDKQRKFPKISVESEIGCLLRDAICGGDQRITEFLWKHTRVFIHSPLFTVGVSIEDANFDAIYCFVEKNNTLTHIELMQQIARYRVSDDDKNVPVYIGWSNLSTMDFNETDPEQIKRNLEFSKKYYLDKAKSLPKTKFGGLYQYLTEQNSPTFDMEDPLLGHLVNIAASRNFSYNSLRNLLKSEIIMRDAYFEELTTPTFDEETEIKERKKARKVSESKLNIESKEADHLTLITTVDVINQAKYTELINSSHHGVLLTDVEKAQCDAFEICSTFNIQKETLNEKNLKETYDIQKGKDLASAFKTVFLNSTENDVRQIKKKETVEKIKHYSVKKDLMLELVNDMQIEYGKAYSRKIIYEILKTVMEPFIARNYNKLMLITPKKSASAWKINNKKDMGKELVNKARKIFEYCGFSFNLSHKPGKTTKTEEGEKREKEYMLLTPYNYDPQDVKILKRKAEIAPTESEERNLKNTKKC
jgi:hypothetical protein